MGILLLSIVASCVIACVLWLVLGDRFPLAQVDKFPAHNNIFIYTLLLVIPIYLVIFIIF